MSNRIRQLQVWWLAAGLGLLLVPAQAFAPAAARRPADSAFDLAAERNAQLRTDLIWHFGGRQQRGWYLYEALIVHLIGADDDAASVVFAEALAEWQQTNGMDATGVLDRDTWMKMVHTFQSQRIRDRSVASEDDLIRVSAEEFYDPERPDDLRYVERETWDAYKRLLAAAEADLRSVPESHLKIISAFRSPAYQAQLRRQSPKSGRAGLARHSPHFTGRALDLYVGGEPVTTRDDNRALQVSTPAYRWLVKNAHRFGFYPYFYEPWHWEYRPQ